MKKAIFIITFFWGAIFYAQTTIIYKDQSGSVRPSLIQIKKEQTIIKKTLLERINQAGDQVIISYLYKNTGNISNAKVLVFEPTENTIAPASTAGKAREKTRLMREKFLFISKVLRALNQDVPKSNETHILASLPKIYDQLLLHADIRVIYLSDMLEYSPIRKLFLRSKSDAEQKGRRDAQRIIQDFNLSKRAFSQLKIDCYLPVGMMNHHTTFSYLSYYWETVFKTVFATDNLKFHGL